MAKAMKKTPSGRPLTYERPQGVRFTTEDDDFFREIGGGNVSRGVRRAAEIIRRVDPATTRELLRDVAILI